MKRGGYLRRKTSLRSTSKSSKKASRKLATKGYAVPAWFMAIPYGSHGNTPAQKRLWKVCSDTWRKEDWEQDPHCRSCGKHLLDWRDGQLGHFKKWGACNSWFKYDRSNLSLQCAGCNCSDDGPMVHALGEYLLAKYGPNHIARIEIENESYRGVKMQEWEIVEKAAEIAPHLVS